MFSDARAVPSGRIIESEVCVIGSGPAGIAIARELAKAGRSVLLLESGGIDPDPDIQKLSVGENAGLPYFPLDECRVRGFSGSALGWEIAVGNSLTGARYAPLDDIDFERRDAVPYSGWPFSRSHLLPYYELAQEMLGLGPFTYRVQDWMDAQGTPPLPVERDVLETTIFQFNTGDQFTTTYKNELAGSELIAVLHHATVVSIDTDEAGGSVQKVEAATLTGNRFAVSARVFVLAAGGIENARLLLVSNQVHQNGLGNSSDLVGRFFMEHPHFVTGILVPDDTSMLSRPAYSDVHVIDGVPVQRMLKMTQGILRRERMLNYVFRLTPVPWNDGFRHLALQPPQADGVDSLRALAIALGRDRRLPPNAARHVRNLFKDIDDLARAGLAPLRWALRSWSRGGSPVPPDGTPALYQLNVMAEQAPNPESRVTLSDRVDALGMRLLDPRCRQVRLDWRLSDVDIRTLSRAREIVGQQLAISDLGKVRMRYLRDGLPSPMWGGNHHMGTTRMHADARYGVVDAHCKVHGVANLYVAGSSVFPTSGCVNPTLTIVALALRLAEHINRDTGRRLEVAPEAADPNPA